MGAWVKLDSHRAMNAKLRQAGFAARGLDEAAMCQVAYDGTDGFISTETVKMLASLHHEKRWLRLVSRLVEVGRWHEVEHGWVIHDYLEYNPSKADWQRIIAGKQAAGRLGGQATAAARGQADAAAPAQAASLRFVSRELSLSEKALQLLADRRLKNANPRNPTAYRRSVITGLQIDLADRLATAQDHTFTTPQQLADWLEPEIIALPTNFAPGSGRLPNWSKGEA